MKARCYFITFTYYGQRLQGDRRGSVNGKGRRIAPNAILEAENRARQKEDTVALAPRERAFALDQILTICKECRYWIDAVNVRSNHTHLVVCSLDGDALNVVASNIKGKLGAELRKSPHFCAQDKIWTRSFNGVELTSIGNWRSRVHYTLYRQGSNRYFKLTSFAVARNVAYDAHGEPINLFDAFQVERNAALRAHAFRRSE